MEVEDLVLFGDKMDVKIEKSKQLGTTPSEGGTINYELRPTTHATPGTYYHSKIQIADHPYYKSKPGEVRWFNLIHLDKLNGEAIGKYLCKVSGHSDFRKENVWSRYDWCHWRNWGGYEEKEPTNDSEEENFYDDDDEEPKEDKDRWKIFFVAVHKAGEKVSEIGRITMDADCIRGDWNYGLRVVDSNTHLAYAYVFGDVLVNDELSCNGEYPESDFFMPIDKFLV